MKMFFDALRGASKTQGKPVSNLSKMHPPIPTTATAAVNSRNEGGGSADAAGVDAAPELPHEPMEVLRALAEGAAHTATATGTNDGARLTSDITPVVKVSVVQSPRSLPFAPLHVLVPHLLVVVVLRTHWLKP